MANDLTAYTPKLLAQGLMALREYARTPTLVNRQYETLAGQKGSSVDVPVPAAIASKAVVPGATPPATDDMAPTTVSIELDQWREGPFYMTDKDFLEVDRGTLPSVASEAIRGVANYVDQYLLALFAKFYGYVGTAGTTPFGSTPGVTDAINSRKMLNKQLAPLGDRHMMLDPDAAAAALGVNQLSSIDFTGDVEAIREGNLNRRLGAMWWENQNVQSHTAGTITTGLIAKAATAQAIGLKAVVCTTAASTGACALLVGDIISFANHAQTYVVTANATQASAASDVTVNIEPGLQVALTGSEAVTVRASHVMNGMFHRNAIALASRPLESITHPAVITQSITDPITALTLRLQITHEHKRVRFSYDVLFGAQVIRRELGTRLAG